LKWPGQREVTLAREEEGDGEGKIEGGEMDPLIFRLLVWYKNILKV
jgi:hypothetical protein